MAEPVCPICRKPQNVAFKPFCSKRCAELDLGRWLGGKYAIPGAASEDRSGNAAGGDSGPETDPLDRD